jgi:hypothetical protein
MRFESWRTGLMHWHCVSLLPNAQQATTPVGMRIPRVNAAMLLKNVTRLPFR